jgi:hypothetical protein
MHGPSCIFWANLTAFSLQHLEAELERLETPALGLAHARGVLGEHVFGPGREAWLDKSWRPAVIESLRLGAGAGIWPDRPAGSCVTLPSPREHLEEVCRRGVTERRGKSFVEKVKKQNARDLVRADRLGIGDLLQLTAGGAAAPDGVLTAEPAGNSPDVVDVEATEVQPSTVGLFGRPLFGRLWT